jgi:hypothetical protein
MNRTCSIIIIACALVLPVCAQNKVNGQAGAATSEPQNIEGLYDFVSETDEITKPEKKTKTRTSEEWEGVWHFCGGYFYRIVRKKTLSPEVHSELESATGAYRIQGDDLILLPQVSQLFRTPMTEKMALKFEDDRLILTRELIPSYESISAGKVTVVLRRRN